jgi:hypothetical protein
MEIGRGDAGWLIGVHGMFERSVITRQLIGVFPNGALRCWRVAFEYTHRDAASLRGSMAVIVAVC